jgi:glycosyltransferase involved in cell wall biosynthesis
MKIEIVVSIYNEIEIINQFHKTLFEYLENIKIDFRIIYVNDGSHDGTREKLAEIKQLSDKITVINFSRNYGHEAAMIAGIDAAKGDAVICMDGDLQHPVEKISEMVQAFKEGAEIVKMKRLSREDGGIYKRISSALFYKVLNLLSPVKFSSNATDYFLISSRVCKILRNEYRERSRFLRGILEMLGFNLVIIPFEAKSRTAGESKYSFVKLAMLSLNALVSFSSKPLIIGLGFGLLSILFSFGIIIFSVYNFFFTNVPSGYSTIVVLMSFLFCILFFILGIICIYLAYLIEETRKRPIYLIDEILI